MGDAFDSEIQELLKGLKGTQEKVGNTLLTAKKFTVEKRKVKLADGKEFEREVCVHPGAVTILPLIVENNEEKVVVIFQYRFAVGEPLIELCAGTLEPPEEPIVCAERELEEETGYKSKHIEPFALLPDFYPSPGVLTEKMYVFVAKDLTQVGHKQEDSEFIKTRALSKAQVKELLARSRIRDAKTALVLSLWSSH